MCAPDLQACKLVACDYSSDIMNVLATYKEIIMS